jgi:hypothetical protein
VYGRGIGFKYGMCEGEFYAVLVNIFCDYKLHATRVFNRIESPLSKVQKPQTILDRCENNNNEI